MMINESYHLYFYRSMENVFINVSFPHKTILNIYMYWVLYKVYSVWFCQPNMISVVNCPQFYIIEFGIWPIYSRSAHILTHQGGKLSKYYQLDPFIYTTILMANKMANKTFIADITSNNTHQWYFHFEREMMRFHIHIISSQAAEKKYLSNITITARSSIF